MSGEFQLGQFEVTGRADAEPAAPPPVTRARQRSGGGTLPDWMRDPPPPRRTIGGRVVDGLTRLPGGGQLRRGWWAWQGRRRLYERFPYTFKIIAFFASWVLATVLVLAAYAIFSLA